MNRKNHLNANGLRRVMKTIIAIIGLLLLIVSCSPNTKEAAVPSVALAADEAVPEHDDCPRLALTTDELRDASTIDPAKLDGWQLAWKMGDAPQGLEEVKAPYLVCHKGSAAGENANFKYCGGMQSYDTKAYLRRVDQDPDGTINGVVRRDFMIVYDAYGEYRETKCGAYLDDQARPLTS